MSISKILPANVREEFKAAIQAAAGKQSKIDGARRMVSSRLIMSKGMKWWNENQKAVLAEMNGIEKGVSE